MLRFRLLGIPYEITPYFWIGTAIFGSSVATGRNGLLLLAVWIACVLVSIVAHELGHALAARRYGVQPYVSLYQLGGLTYLPGASLARGEHILVSLAGPAAGGVMFLAIHTARYLMGVSGTDDLLYAPTQSGLIVRQAIEFLLFINGWWTLFNLLPIQPLDGGQVLREALGPGLLRVTRLIGTVCAVACCGWAVLHGQPFLALFLGFLAYSNFTGDTRSLPGGIGR